MELYPQLSFFKQMWVDYELIFNIKINMDFKVVQHLKTFRVK